MSKKFQRERLKPVFPILYLSVFIYTIVHMFLGYVSSEPPPIINGVIGSSNQATVLFITYVFAFLLCFYDIVYYARLEVFEHNYKPRKKIPPLKSFFEFILRLTLVSVVALKIIEYDALDDMFVFSAIVCLLISVWLIYLKFCDIDDVSVFDLVPNITICLLSVFAASRAVGAEYQTDNAILVLIIALLLSILLAGNVFYLTYKFGKDIYKLTQGFFVQWGVLDSTNTPNGGQES